MSNDETFISVDFDDPKAKEFMLHVIMIMSAAELLNYLAMSHGFDLEDYALGTIGEYLDEEEEKFK